MHERAQDCSRPFCAHSSRLPRQVSPRQIPSRAPAHTRPAYRLIRCMTIRAGPSQAVSQCRRQCQIRCSSYNRLHDPRSESCRHEGAYSAMHQRWYPENQLIWPLGHGIALAPLHVYTPSAMPLLTGCHCGIHAEARDPQAGRRRSSSR